MAANEAELLSEPQLPEEEAGTQEVVAVEQPKKSEVAEVEVGQSKELQDTSQEILDDREASCTNPRALAEAMDSIIEAGLTEDAIKKVIETNPRLAKPELDAGELAHDIVKVEQELVAPLKKQIEEAAEADQQAQELAPRAICSVREALYGMILKGYMSADKIKEFTPGGFVFQLEAGDEYRAKGTAPEKAYAYSGGNAQGLRTTYLYRNFLYSTHPNLQDKVTWRRQSHLVRHEIIGHPIERSNVWDESDFLEYRTAAQSLDEASISQIVQKNPELGQMLRLLQNPDLLARVSSPYVASLCRDLQNVPPENETQRNLLRDAIACEAIADTVACFIESGRSQMSFLNNQLTFSRKKLMKYIESSREIDDASRFALSTGQMSMEKMIQILKADPGMKLVFESNRLWHAKLTEAFRDRGKNLAIHQRQNEEEYDDDDYGYYDFDSDMDTPRERQDEGGYGHSRNAGWEQAEPNVFVDILDFLTGHNKKPEANAGVNGQGTSGSEGGGSSGIGGGGGGNGGGSEGGDMISNMIQRGIRGKPGNLKYFEGEVKTDLQGPRTLESVMAYIGRNVFEKVKAAVVAHERTRGRNITMKEASKIAKMEFDRLFNSSDNIESWSDSLYIRSAGLTDQQIARLKLGYAKLKHESLRSLASAKGDREQSLIDERMEKLMFGGSGSSPAVSPSQKTPAIKAEVPEKQLDQAA